MAAADQVPSIPTARNRGYVRAVDRRHRWEAAGHPRGVRRWLTSVARDMRPLRGARAVALSAPWRSSTEMTARRPHSPTVRECEHTRMSRVTQRDTTVPAGRQRAYAPRWAERGRLACSMTRLYPGGKMSYAGR